MNRGMVWRKRMETMKHLQRSIPVEHRGHGSYTWNMSLRGAWERFVPLGGTFSGLFLSINDEPPAEMDRWARIHVVG